MKPPFAARTGRRTVSSWSLSDYSVELGVYASVSKRPFVFQTPKNAE